MIIKKRRLEGKLVETTLLNYDRAVPPEESLKMVCGAFYLPKDNELKPEGEDAHFICSEKQAIGVADGVGGWAKKGVDAGEYARELMNNAFIAIQQQPDGVLDPKRVLNEAFLNTEAEGSSTACIAMLKDNILHSVNVGDSGFCISRRHCSTTSIVRISWETARHVIGQVQLKRQQSRSSQETS
jgi:serine/threonine protein phosphatase PrpC